MLNSIYGFVHNYGPNPGNQQQSPGHNRRPTTLSSSSPDKYDRQPRRSPSSLRPLQHQSPGSPGPSVLLDPHHRPSTSGFRSMHRHGPRFSRRQKPPGISEAIVDENDERQLATRSSNIPSVRVQSQKPVGSTMEESWRMEEEEEEEGDSDEEEGGGGNTNTGVLGLIQQFQKERSVIG